MVVIHVLGAVMFLLPAQELTLLKKTVYVADTKTFPNPRPDNYNILAVYEVGNYLIIKIRYLDCVNYEGVKILLFENCTIEQLIKQNLIDPHFSDDKSFHSPIARFEPTQKGLELAVKFVKMLNKLK